MPIDPASFAQLCQKLATIDLFGKGPPAPPWGAQPTAAKARKAIDSGSAALPLVYQTAYVEPLIAHLDTVLTRARADLEPFLAPIYQHAENSPVLPHLGRFLAVISNLYRSFLGSPPFLLATKGTGVQEALGSPGKVAAHIHKHQHMWRRTPFCPRRSGRPSTSR